MMICFSDNIETILCFAPQIVFYTILRTILPFVPCGCSITSWCALAASFNANCWPVIGHKYPCSSPENM